MNFQTDILPWLPPMVTVVGWAVVNRQNNKRERRKETRAVLDGTKKRIVEVSAQAVKCMCDPPRDPSAEAEVKVGLDEIELELGRLRFYKRSKDLVRAVADFGDACTGADFESIRWRERLRSSAEAQAIVRTRNSLLHQLEERFATTFD